MIPTPLPAWNALRDSANSIVTCLKELLSSSHLDDTVMLAQHSCMHFAMDPGWDPWHMLGKVQQQLIRPKESALLPMVPDGM